MSKNTDLTVEKRDFSKKAKQLRAEGKVPATIYGHGFEAISIQLSAKAFQQAYKGDKTAILELKSGKETYSVMAKNIQQQATQDEILNIEFYKINADEKLKVQVPVEIVGVSPAVKAGGTLWNPLTEIEVECLPKNIPSSIKVDVSKLENLDESLNIGDIDFPQGVTPAMSEDTMVLRVNSTASAEAAAPVESQEVAELAQS